MSRSASARSLLLLSILLGTSGWSAAAAERPTAFELLEEVRAAYQALEHYHDHGQLERLATTAEGTQLRTLLRFETVVQGEDLRWQVALEGNQAGRDHVLWRGADGAFHYDAELGQYQAVDSLAGELARGFGDGTYQGLAVLATLLGSVEPLSDPEAAYVDGPLPCDDDSGEQGAATAGANSCYLLETSRLATGEETSLWIEVSSRLLRRVETRLDASWLPTQGAGWSANHQEILIRVEHDLLTTALPTAEPITFSPPDDARRVNSFERPGDAEAGNFYPPYGFADEISVDLVTVEARVVDSRGQPLPDLAPSDFRARIKKREVPISAVDWLSSWQSFDSLTPDTDLTLAEIASSGIAAEKIPGKLVVIYIQSDFNALRITGQLRLLPMVAELLDTLHPNDYVAVVTFDSHLRLWHDFSRDRQQISEILKKAIRFGGEPAPRRGRGPSLLEHWNQAAARDVATPERALHVTAQALFPLDGAKDLIYLGWGLGRFGAGGVRMTAEFRPAVRALTAARVTVSVLDVTDADFHSLEVGLQNVAASTGGTYARTHRFARRATEQLAATLTGHYLLSLDMSGLQGAAGVVTIELRDPKRGRVIYTPLRWN